jgi:hypothetical protein
VQEQTFIYQAYAAKGETQMKSLLNKFAVIVTLALATTVAAKAQNASTVEYGRTILIFNPAFTSGIASLGATLGGVGFSSVDSTGMIVFPVVSGAVDLQTGAGEVNHLGGISVIANGISVRLQNFLLDTTKATPVLTALLVVNNKLMTRIPLFDLVVPGGTTLPLPTTVGVLQLNGWAVTMDATGAATINAIFGAPAVYGGQPVGSLNLYAVLTPNSSN